MPNQKNDISQADRDALLAGAKALNEASADLILDGEYDAAARAAREALDIRNALLAGDDPLIGQCLVNLATALMEQGRYDEALPLLQRAHTILETSAGPDALEVAPVLNTWAMLHEMRGEFVEARALYERALAIVELGVDQDDPLISVALNNLARLLLTQGDWSAAEPILQRAAAVLNPEVHGSHLATVLNNLSGVRFQQGDYAGARTLLERVRALREQEVGPDHPKMSIALGNLGAILILQGAYAEARRVLEKALAIAETAYGPDHPQCAQVLHSLGWLETRLGEYGAARERFARALYIVERTRADHPLLAKMTANAAHAEWLAGRSDDARRLLLRTASVLKTNVEEIFPALAPAEQRHFVEEWVQVMADYVFLMFGPESAAFPAGYAFLAGWKGLLLAGLRYQSAARRALGTNADGDFESLHEARLRVAHIASIGGDDEALSAIEMERERLERALASAIPAEARLDRWSTARGSGLEALCAALPGNTVFVDIYEHTQFADGETSSFFGAAVVTKAAPPMRVDIGISPFIEAAIVASLAFRGQDGYMTRVLAERVWGPVAKVLPPGTSRVWVSPDGSLSRVPWSVLAEAYAREGETPVSVAQVPSARALLELLGTPPPAEAGTVFLVGDVYFGRSGDGEPAWSDLEGTWDEVQSISECARVAGMSPDVVVGADATPATVVQGAQTAAYVHIATHGFFGGSTREEEAERLASAARGFPPVTADAEIPAFPRRSPLATSGLALAGANLGPEGNLTAEEIVGLDLRGARLVVLSACDTGRGAEVTGQGVLGLQSAILAAGARTLLMSLWPVDDDATAALMGAFYRSLWLARRCPADALRAAQEAVRTTSGWEAPLYWAGWSLVGDAF